MKGILVMEMPESCMECPMEMNVEDTSGNKWQGNICRGCGKRHADKRKRPDWCPLVPMPEKKEGAQYGTYSDGFFTGWNYCLDTIEGREKNG